MAKYTTNFVKKSFGNGIAQGSELIVRVTGAEVVTGQIRHPNHGPITIDQSHSKDEDNDAETINLKMKRRRWLGLKKDDLPKGKYELRVWYWDNDTMTGGGFRDFFEIF